MEGAELRIGGAAFAVETQELLRTLREHTADFATATFDERDAHGVVASGLVAEPGDGGGLGAFLERDAFGAGDSAAADGRGVGGDQGSEEHGVGGVGGMKGEEGENGCAEVLDVVGLLDGAALAGGGEFAFVGGVGALGEELGAKGGDAVGGSPDAAGEAFVALLLRHRPRRAVGLDAAAESGVAGREQGPAGGHGLENGVLVEDVAGFLAGADFAGDGGHR